MPIDIVYPKTIPGRLDLIFSAFQTGDAFTAPAPSTTKPSTGLLPDHLIRNQLVFTPIGIGSAAQTVQALLVGWYKEHINGVYVPIELLRVTGTLGTTTVVVGANTWRFCDSLVIAAAEGLEGSALVAHVRKSQGGIAYVIIDNPGCELIQFKAHKNASATSANVLAGSY